MKDKNKSLVKLRDRARVRIAEQDHEQKKLPPAHLLHEMEVHRAGSHFLLPEEKPSIRNPGFNRALRIEKRNLDC